MIFSAYTRLVRICGNFKNNPRRPITSDGKDIMKQKLAKSTPEKIFLRRFFIIFIMTVSAFLITVCFIRFCRVKAVTVSNNVAVDTTVILENANIKANKHLFAVNIQKIKSNVLNASPYIKAVEVKRSFPSEITIEVEEYEADYCVCIMNKYYLVSDALLVLQEIPEEEINLHPAALLRLPEINTSEKKFGVGKKLVFMEKEDGEFVTEALKTVSQSFLSDCLTSLALDEEANITAIVNDRYTLRLGNKKELDKKIAMCEESIAYLQENMPSITGTLFAWTTKQVTFEMTGAN